MSRIHHIHRSIRESPIDAILPRPLVKANTLPLIMAGKEALVQQIKNMQRIDSTFRQTWWDFCESQLGGVRDPNRHDESVLGTFLEQYNTGAIAPRPSVLRSHGGAKEKAKVVVVVVVATVAATTWGQIPGL